MKSSSLEINTPVLVLVGPTAVGKTALTFDIADTFDCEIISMDSMQVYRSMDIGTAKPSKDERQQVRHHLIDIVDPDEQYHAARFVQDCLGAIKVIAEQGKIPLITGGTGLYLSSLINGLFDDINVKDEVRESLLERMNREGAAPLHAELVRVDPASGERIHGNDRQRIIRGLEIYHSTGIPWSEHLERQKNMVPPVCFKRLFEIALTCDREALHKRIEQRTIIMLEQGLIDEVKGLRARGYDPALSSMQSIGYRHVNQYLDGRWDFDEMTEFLVRDTRRYAKRQMTWFRRHKSLHWYQRTESAQIISDARVCFSTDT
jgi:tRNA dimethylallyltransferase